MVYGPERLEIHRSIVYFDSFFAWLWSWNAWNFTDLLQFYCYTDMNGLVMVDFLTVYEV